MQQSFTLTPKQPFAYQQSYQQLQTFQASGVHVQATHPVLRFALEFNGEAVLVALEPAPDGTLRVAFTGDAGLLAQAQPALLSRVRFMFGLDDDMSDFYALAEADAAFAPVLAQLYGYHQLKFPSVFSCACWALVTQRTPNSFAFKTMRSLVLSLGPAITVNGMVFHAFPSPDAFLTPRAAPLLLAATNNTRKTGRLQALARAFAVADETFLRSAPYAEVLAWLKSVHGLGQWSAEYILLRGLGRTERLPWTDTALNTVISRVYTGGLQISRGDIRMLAERYGWQQGLWFHYLKTYDPA